MLSMREQKKRCLRIYIPNNLRDEWLDKIEGRLDYVRRYCGHYHTNKSIDRLRFLFEDFLEIR